MRTFFCQRKICWIWINDITENHELLRAHLSFRHPNLLYLLSYTSSSFAHDNTNIYLKGASLISIVLLVLVLTLKGIFSNISSTHSQKFRCPFHFFINYKSCNEITVSYLKSAMKCEVKPLAVKILFLSPLVEVTFDGCSFVPSSDSVYSLIATII